MPWLPSASIWTLTMLVGGFGGFPGDYTRLGWCVLAMTVVYLVFGVHASFHRAVTEPALRKLREANEAPEARRPAALPARGGASAACCSGRLVGAVVPVGCLTCRLPLQQHDGVASDSAKSFSTGIDDATKEVTVKSAS